jgi:HTH-type transcriptional regulator / antitoxin HigA
MSTKVTSIPAIATHPGKILIDELDARDISQTDFALKLGVKKSLLNEIIKGKRDINAELALLLESSLHIPATFWMNAQSNYAIAKAKIEQRSQDRMDAIQQWEIYKELLPSKYLAKIGVITKDPVVDLPIVQKMYNVTSADGIVQQLNNYKVRYTYFRKSTQKSSDVLASLAWVKLVQYKANEIEVGEFTINHKEKLIADLKLVINKNKNLLETCKSLLAAYGIKLIILPKPEGTYIDGVTLWSNYKPTIGITLRYRTLDKFVFTLFHELGHVFLHLVNNNQSEFLDVDLENLKGISMVEEEADEFAQTHLIPKQAWQNFVAGKKNIYFFNDNLIAPFAKELGIEPSIIKGRLCKHYNEFKFPSKFKGEIK